MFPMAFFAKDYLPGAYFPPLSADSPGAPPTYGVSMHVANAGSAAFVADNYKNLRLHVGNAESVRFQD